MINNMNIVFMGTPDFAVPSLEILIEKFNVTAVFTQPDRPKGRGKKIAMSPVKETAIKYDIPVYQPEKIRKEPEMLELLKKLNPDFIVVVAFGQILPKEVLEIPKKACINLHASLLPKYRGAAPINWAIINGEKVSGNTTMLMDVGLDTGNMLLKQEVKISENMTMGELHDDLMEKGAGLLAETIVSYDDITPIKQNDEKTCYASKINKKIGEIDWNISAEKIHNLIRGLNPWPAAYTTYNDKIMKLYESEVIKKENNSEPGTIIECSKDGIKVAAKDGIVNIKKIQFPGKKPLNVDEYLRGHSIEVGTILK